MEPQIKNRLPTPAEIAEHDKAGGWWRVDTHSMFLHLDIRTGSPRCWWASSPSVHVSGHWYMNVPKEIREAKQVYPVGFDGKPVAWPLACEYRKGLPSEDVLRRHRNWLCQGRNDGSSQPRLIFEVRDGHLRCDWFPFAPADFSLYPIKDSMQEWEFCPADADFQPLPWSSVIPQAPTPPAPSPAKTPIMPAKESPVAQPVQTQTAAPSPAKSRARRTFEEASRRAPVELGLNRLHKLIVRQAMRRFRGTRSERAVVQRFLGDLLSSDFGKALTGGALAAAIPFFAPVLGKHAPKADAVADELATRSFTVAQVAVGGAVLDKLGPLVEIISGMVASWGGKESEAAALPPSAPDPLVDFLPREQPAKAGV